MLWLLKLSCLGNTEKEKCYHASVVLSVNCWSDKQIWSKEKQPFIAWLDLFCWVLKSAELQGEKRMEKSALFTAVWLLSHPKYEGFNCPIFLCITSSFLWLISFQFLSSWLTFLFHDTEENQYKTWIAQIQFYLWKSLQKPDKRGYRLRLNTTASLPCSIFRNSCSGLCHSYLRCDLIVEDKELLWLSLRGIISYAEKIFRLN